VGQTTLVLGLANELVTLGKRVLVVDLHPHFGHVAFYLGLDAPGADLADLAEFPVSLTVGSLGDLVKVHASGVRVLAGPEDLLRGQTMDLHHLIPRILELEDLVDYVLLDLPAGVPDALLPILDAARFLFLVTNGSLGSLKSTKQAYNLFLMLEYPRSKIRPVMTGLHAEESIRRVLDQMLVKSDTPLTQLFPEDEEGAHQAMSLGQPITRIFPKSPFTRAVRKFLAPLLEVSQEDMGVSPDSGLFSSLFGRIFGE
jgi:pilus assembly protein CpaE